MAGIKNSKDYALTNLTLLSSVGSLDLKNTFEEISYNASDLEDKDIVIDAAYVDQHLTEFADDEDLSRYIL